MQALSSATWNVGGLLWDNINMNNVRIDDNNENECAMEKWTNQRTEKMSGTFSVKYKYKYNCHLYWAAYY